MKAKAKKKPASKASASKPAKARKEPKALKTAKKAAPAAKRVAKTAQSVKPAAQKGKSAPEQKKLPKAVKEKPRKAAPFADPDDEMVLDAAELENEALGGEIDGETIEIETDEDLEADDLHDDVDEDDETPTVTAESSSEDIILTDAEGNRYCRARDCDQIAAVDAYCRYHYLLFWKKIQVRKRILADGKLERYVDELTARYPDKFLEMIRRDLRSEKDFLSAIQELEIDEAGLDNEYEEDTQSFIDEVRGMGGGESEGVEDDY